MTRTYIDSEIDQILSSIPFGPGNAPNNKFCLASSVPHEAHELLLTLGRLNPKNPKNKTLYYFRGRFRYVLTPNGSVGRDEK